MVIYVDIDETICHTIGTSYALSRPIFENIEKINKLYNENNLIIYWTARGSHNVSRVSEYKTLTQTQLKDWGCLYHELNVGTKPVYDLLICDKSCRIEEL